MDHYIMQRLFLLVVSYVKYLTNPKSLCHCLVLHMHAKINELTSVLQLQIRKMQKNLPERKVGKKGKNQNQLTRKKKKKHPKQENYKML